METLKTKFINFKNNMAMRMVGVNPHEYESGDHLLEVLGVIIIAIVLLIFFKDKITALFNTVMNNTNTQVTDLWKNMGTT